LELTLSVTLKLARVQNFGFIVSFGAALPRAICDRQQGCQMVSFQTKNPNLGKFRRALDWKMLIHFTAVFNILQTFGIFYDNLVHLVFVWYIFPVWVSCTNKNLAALTGCSRVRLSRRSKIGWNSKDSIELDCVEQLNVCLCRVFAGFFTSISSSSSLFVLNRR
jgi:hypothetical protein